jgi:hypothetical protein
MPTAAAEKIRSRVEGLNETLRATQEAMRRSLLEKGAAILEVQKELDQDLQEALREGQEKRAFLDTLATVRSQAERWAEWFRRALAVLEGDALAAAPLDAQAREAEQFLASVRRLEAHISTPFPLFDESRLSPAPDGPTAEGYIRISEARARVGKRRLV